MATTQQIYEQMAAQVTTEAALAELAPNPDSATQLTTDMSSGSKVSIHRLIMWVYAYLTKLQRDLWDRFKQETLDLAIDGHYGTVRWFIAKAKAFQYGDTLILTEKDAHYAVDDPAARIVTQAAVVESANTVLVKVAKTQGSGLVPLDPAEWAAVTAYFEDLRPPVQVAVLTSTADKVRAYGTVIYDGQVGLATAQAAVHAALATYLMGLDFNGALRLTDMKAAMLSAVGVVDVRFSLVRVSSAGGAWVNVPRIHYTYAGHAVLDSSMPITTTMNWFAGNA